MGSTNPKVLDHIRDLIKSGVTDPEEISNSVLEKFPFDSFDYESDSSYDEQDTSRKIKEVLEDNTEVEIS